MRSRWPTRRSFLATGAVCLAGCIGRPAASDETSSGDERDGYPPTFESTPETRSIETDTFRRLSIDGTGVPLVPIDDAYYWYRRREARFADARGERSYSRSHILGAVLSPAPDGGRSDPVGDWPQNDRIVCYCGCPHHLSSLRAASLIRNGYDAVYVIDEGFWEWYDRGYPMAGSDIETQPRVQEIRGMVAPRYAGETVWAWHEPSGQRETAMIDRDGSYRIQLRFTGVDAESTILLVTPAYRLRKPLGELRDRVIT